ncbi:lytic murein transglycosylase [Streptomyces sp. NPDC048002]|uniref:lytic transglycosylase domain-containing protein n=1 Tax=Streptomyces sp. NPDC048002 TaxID=3154344 RepID=UPI003408E324
MPRPFARPVRRGRARSRARRGTLAAATATVAAALLTAGSQAPAPSAAGSAPDDGSATPVRLTGPGTPLPEVPSQGDDSYHVELPPLESAKGTARTRGGTPSTPRTRRVTAEAGLPASVFAAYRAAAASVARTDPGCRLRWELLAAIGKVESGHAGGGAVDANGDTLTRITGPALDGNGFALILDSENGAWDGDPVYDRAVGPMQFLPTTWKSWGADGNGDGVADPNNIHDAALAAGHYLCAGDRDLATAAGLERAVLSYNHSRAYLNLVLGWMEFYLRGVHTVPDGEGVVPESPGAGGPTPATRPVPDRDDERPAAPERPDDPDGAQPPDEPAGNGDGGATPAPTSPPRPPVLPSPSAPTPSPSTGASASPDPTAEPTPTTTPEPTPGDSATDPAPSPDPSESATPTPTPTPTESPAATPSGEAAG